MKCNISYWNCHVSPNYIGDTIEKNDLIGHVDSKYVYGIICNQYLKENRIPTNGTTTGCHLHFGFRIDGKYNNPFH